MKFGVRPPRRSQTAGRGSAPAPAITDGGPGECGVEVYSAFRIPHSALEKLS